MRTPSEQALVDAIIDAETTALEIQDKAKSQGEELGRRLTSASRKIVGLRIRGELTPAAAREAFREVYLALVLAGFVEVAQDVLDHSDNVVREITERAKKMGADLVKAGPIRRPDFLAREMAKRRAQMEEDERERG